MYVTLNWNSFFVGNLWKLNKFSYLFRLVEQFDWNGTFLIIGAIVLLNVLFGALFRPLVSSSNSSETTTTSNQDVAENVDDVKSSLYKIPNEKETGCVSLNHSFTNGHIPVISSISQNGSFIDSDNNAMLTPPNSPVKLFLIDINYIWGNKFFISLLRHRKYSSYLRS